MEIIKKHSKLHKELQLEEYLIPFKNLDDIKTKEEFVNYVEYFQIDKKYLLEQILDCHYLEYLHEYMKDDIIDLLEYDHSNALNDKNLEYISKYIVITELCASFNSKITTVEPFAKTLKILYASGDCGINNKCLKEATNLEELNVDWNSKITSIKPFAKTLKILSAEGKCGIDDNNLKRAINLEELYAESNTKITTIKPFTKTLKILHAKYNCGIDDKGLEGAINLQKLYSRGNPKITKKLKNLITKQ